MFSVIKTDPNFIVVKSKPSPALTDRHIERLEGKLLGTAASLSSISVGSHLRRYLSRGPSCQRQRPCASAFRAPTNRVECGQCSTNCTIAIISVYCGAKAPSQSTWCCSSTPEVARRAHRCQRRAQPTRGPPLPGARRTDAHRHLEESHRSLHAICYYVTSHLLRAGGWGQGRFSTGKCAGRLLFTF